MMLLRSILKHLMKNEKKFLNDPRTYMHQLEFLEPKLEDSIPIYRVFDQQGKVIDPSQDPNVSAYNFCY